MLIAAGTLSGRGGHVLRGRFTLTQTGEGVVLQTSDDFFFDGSADPGWALFDGIPLSSSDPEVIKAAAKNKFQRLTEPSTYPHREVSGPQTAHIPPALDIDCFKSVFVWCYRVSFLVGIGPFERVRFNRQTVR